MLTGIKYFEKPVSYDEKEIAKVIEILLDGCKKNNCYIFEQYFLDDAIIELESGAKKLNKKEFLNYFKTHNHTLKQLYYNNVIIRIKSPTYAIVYSMCHRQHNDGTPSQVNQRQFRFIKKQSNNRWYISKSLCAN